MDGEQRRGGAEFDREIAVGNGVHGVLRDARLVMFVDEAEKFRHEFAIDRQSGGGNGAAAERTNVRAKKTIFHAATIALEHFAVSEQMMRKKNRLGPLQMGV